MGKNTVVLVVVLAVAGCGGGGGGGSSTLPATAGSSTVPSGSAGGQNPSSVTFQIEVPSAMTAASATDRNPEYVAPQTSFFFLDLQGATDPQYTNTFLVDAAHCSNQATVQVCTYTAKIPPGDPTAEKWSIAAGAGDPTSPSSPPLSVLHDYHPCGYPSCANGVIISLWLGVVLADVTNVALGFGYPPTGYYGPAGTPPMAYVSFAPVDAFGNVVFGRFGTNTPLDSWGFENPFTLSEDDRSGELKLETIAQGAPGAILSGGPVSTVTFDGATGLAGPHGSTHALAIVDNATQPRTMNVTYSVPKVELKPSEFPQLHAAWTSPARSGTLLTLTRVPVSSVAAGTNPCTQQGGGTGTVLIH